MSGGSRLFQLLGQLEAHDRELARGQQAIAAQLAELVRLLLAAPEPPRLRLVDLSASGWEELLLELFPALGPAKTAVLAHFLARETDKESAAALGKSPNTVKTQISEICEKFDLVDDRSPRDALYLYVSDALRERDFRRYARPAWPGQRERNG